jgi:hypothetical protein
MERELIMLTLNKRGLGALVALTALVVSSAAFAADGKDGMKVVRDAATGELRAPTPAEAQTMHAQEKAKAPSKAVGMLTGAVEPQQKLMANGTVMMELTEDSMVYSVVTKKADGSLDMQCVTGSDAANKVINGKSTKQEHKHDK